MHTPPAATGSSASRAPFAATNPSVAPASHDRPRPAETGRVTRLDSLDDDSLIARVDSLTRLERCNTMEILLHLVEVDRRKLWRPLEYRSMFDYCVRRLRYSEAAAGRRIRTARLIARYPYVYDRIRQGRLTLCAVSKVARAVLDDRRPDLIDRIEGKRLDQVDAILATHRNPSRPVRESIRLLCVERPADEPAPPPHLGETPAPGEGFAAAGPAAGGAAAAAGAAAGAGSSAAGDSTAGAGSEPNPAHPGTDPGKSAAVPTGAGAHDQNGGRKLTRVERIFRFQFGIDARTMAKFSRVQSIAARRNGRHVDLSELFGVLCDTYLDRYDAATRAQRKSDRNRANERKQGERPPAAGTTEAAAGGNANQKAPGSQKALDNQDAPGNQKTPGNSPRDTVPEAAQAETAGQQSGAVTRAVRDAVIRRDGGRCTFVDRNGERCTETIALQVDHVRPRALGGSNNTSNLRAMCPAHNRLLAERTFGRDVVERAIEAARAAGRGEQHNDGTGANPGRNDVAPPGSREDHARGHSGTEP